MNKAALIILVEKFKILFEDLKKDLLKLENELDEIDMQLNQYYKVRTMSKQEYQKLIEENNELR